MASLFSPSVIAWLVIAAVCALVLWATLTVSRRPRDGKRKPGGLQMMGAMMLGLGEPFDPASRALVEAKSEQPAEDDESGDPPKT